jgi:glycosyltransferase involved in cell wall biosynthesis
MRSDTRTIKMDTLLRKISDGQAILWNRDTFRETEPPAHRLYINVQLGSKKIFLFLPIWFIWCLYHLIRLKPDAIHGCDIECAIPAYIYTRFRRIPFIYDVHDVTTGRYGAPQGSLVWKAFLYTDYFIMRRAAAILLGDPERIEQWELDAKKPADKALIDKMIVAYNSETMRPAKQTIVFKKGQQLKVTYVGAMSKRIRGLEFILQATKDFPMINFTLAGMGADFYYFQNLFTKDNLPNVTFMGRVSHDEAMMLNCEADFMISLLDPTFENYRFATSTKIFEAMQLGKPMITTTGSVSGKVVDAVGWGEVIPYNYSALKKVLTEITNGKTYLLDGKKTLPYSWDTSENRVIDFYRKLLG